ncbi:MAG: nitroreductase [Chitinophagales bacterium]|nr:nitroreductase [Chitinophagales bacterium]
MSSILQIIENRRTIDPDLFSGEVVASSIIEQMLIATNWAPTHGLTEPWRFIIFTPEKVKTFGKMHADLYQRLTPEHQFLQKKYDKLLHRADKCSHVIVAYNKRGDKSNIPELEEIAATSSAIQNMLLVAEDNSVATFWSTGGMTYHDEMKNIFDLNDVDQILGVIYIGIYNGDKINGIRNTDWKDKVKYY